MLPPHAAYRVWNTDFIVTSSLPEALRALDRLCHQFMSEPSSEAVPVAIEPAEDGSFEVAVGSLPHETRPSEQRAARHAEWGMMRVASRAEQAMVHLHGAVLAHRGRTVLIPGASGTGKSTFALALVAQGFELVADDISFVDLDAGLVQGLQRAPHVHRDAIPLLRDAGFPYRPELHVPGFLEVEAIDRWHRGPAPLPSLVLFVEWEGDDGIDYHTISHAEAAIELQRFSHNLKLRPDGGWAAARRLLAQSRCARMLRAQDLVAAGEVVEQLLE
jgi:hypothetical protein